MQLLGAARLEIGERCGLIDHAAWSFVWVVDAPMFESDDEGKRWTAVHHPFTSPNADWVDRFEESPDAALAWAYDIVCNGNEIGGGSIRIHRADVQHRVFTTLGISEEEAQDKFGFLLDAFQYGPPPHGGHRLRLGPRVHAALRRALAARRHRVSQDWRWVRPPHRGADAHHCRAAARGGR